MRVTLIWFQLAFLFSAQDEEIFAYRPACGKSSLRYTFKLTPAADDIHTIVEIVKPSRSAVVNRSKNSKDLFEITVNSVDFDEVFQKSKSLKVYRYHFAFCVKSKNKNVSKWPTLIPKSYAKPSTKPIKIKKKVNATKRCRRFIYITSAKKEVNTTNKSFFGSIKKILGNQPESSSSKLLNSKKGKLFSRRENKVFGKLSHHKYQILKTEMKTENKNGKKVYLREIRRCNWFWRYYKPVVRIPSRCISIFNHLFPIRHVKPNTAYLISSESEKCTTKTEEEAIGTNKINSTTTEESSTLKVPLIAIVRCKPSILETEIKKEPIEPEISQIGKSKCQLKPNFQNSDYKTINYWDTDQDEVDLLYPE